MRAAARLLTLLAALGLGGAAAGQEPAPPAPPRTPAERVRADVADLVAQVEASRGAEVAFVTTSSSLNFIRGHAWVLSLAVGDAPAYGGEFFVLSDVDGRRVGELLARPGPDGTDTLTGEVLARFLARVELDPTPVEAAFARHYAPRR